MRKVLLLIAILGALALYPGYLRLRQYREEAARLDARAARLRQENEELRNRVARMEAEEVSSEHAARELGMVREGEVIYEVVEEPADGANP